MGQRPRSDLSSLLRSIALLLSDYLHKNANAFLLIHHGQQVRSPPAFPEMTVRNWIVLNGLSSLVNRDPHRPLSPTCGERERPPPPACLPLLSTAGRPHWCRSRRSSARSILLAPGSHSRRLCHAIHARKCRLRSR